MTKKRMTLENLEAARRRAVTMFENFDDDESAAEFDDMTAEEYAEHKGVEIINSNPQARRRTETMEGLTKKERGQLLSYISEQVEVALESNSRADMRATLEEISDLTDENAVLLFSTDGTVSIDKPIARTEDDDEDDEDDDEE